MQILTNNKISYLFRRHKVCVYVCKERETRPEKQVQGQRERQRHTEIFTCDTNFKGYQMGQSLLCFIMIYFSRGITITYIFLIFKISLLGFPWRFSDYDSTLPLQRARFPSMVRQLRFQMSHGMAKK